jgi:molybdopterin molybdotransferase
LLADGGARDAGKADMTGPAAGLPAASPDEVLALVARLCHALDTERVPLADALGRVLREPVCAPEDQPPFDRSSVDGYAVRLDDGATRFRIVDEIRAGQWKPRCLQPGEAVRIATGAALPGEDLQVVMREDAQVDGNTLCVVGSDGHRNIRFRGEDARTGQVLVETGTRLQAGALALLASAGCAHPLVTALPRALHVATGHEIVPPDQTPAQGQIRDSNSTLVRAFLEQRGVRTEQVAAGEELSALQSAICRPPLDREPDLLLISGGASVGEHDFTRQVLEQGGFTVHVSRTTARPGKPLIVAQRRGTIAFGLPGNPLAHFVCLNLYVRAALEALAGRVGGVEPTFETGVLAQDLVAEGPARETFWPARWTVRDGAVTLRPLRWRSSGDLTALASANGLIRVTAGTGRVECGSRVQFVSTQPP